MTAWDGWATLPLLEAFDDVTARSPRVKQRHYRKSGILPVIDQGQAHVGGYVNEPSLACKTRLPCVVFGDHTRIVKYVDHPFAIGAEGVKVLVPHPKLDPRFAFYCLLRARLPDDAGYSRHYRFLKRLRVPVPPLAEQRRIAAALDKADAIRQKRREGLRLLDEFLRSAFLEMFGDPVRNDKGWEVEQLGGLCRVRRGASPRPKGDPRYFGGAIPWIKISDGTVSDGFFIDRAAEGLTEEGKRKSLYLEPGSLILSNSGSVGVSYVLATAGCVHDGWLAFDRYEKRLNKFYLLGLFRELTGYFRRVAPMGTQSNLNTGILNETSIPVPPIEVQQNWELWFRQWHETSKRAKGARHDTDQLFNSLAQRAFGGTAPRGATA